MNKEYRSLIFTDHALERIDSRSVTQEMVYQAVVSPTKKYPSDKTTKFIRMVHQRKVHVVAQYLKDEHKWLVISVWVRGEDDQAPIAWRIITFPFWLVWILVKWLFRLIFNAKTA